ncbi:MAG: alanine racemase [Oscillospiraceae bacterium]|nr:alanine racemase [Oscillospiraceae bacterium]
MRTLIIEKQAIKNNITRIKERAGKAAVYAAVSGDGGGVGAAELARLLREEGIGRFAVSEAAEAEALRKAGLVDEEILMLRSTTRQETLELLLDLNVVCTVGSVEAGLALNGVAEHRSTVAEAHLQLDIGLGGTGFLAGEPEKLLSLYHSLPNVAISGLYTQIHSGERRGIDPTPRIEQFHRAIEVIQAAGLETGMVHTSGSCALMEGLLTGVDGVRVGSALLGRCRRRRGDGLLRVGYGQVEVQETRWLPAGHTVGGAVLTTLKKPARAAVLPVGYQNGFGVSRSQETGLWAALRRWWYRRRVTVLVGDQKAGLIGGIGARETLVDVTGLKCSPGDLVCFDIDPQYAADFMRIYQ